MTKILPQRLRSGRIDRPPEQLQARADHHFDTWLIVEHATKSGNVVEWGRQISVPKPDVLRLARPGPPGCRDGPLRPAAVLLQA